MSGSGSSSPANKSNSPKKSKSPTKPKMEEDFESPESKQQKSYEDALKLQEACPELIKRAEEKYNFKLLDRNDGHLMSAKVSFVIQKEREELGLDKESDEDKSNEISTKSEEEEEEEEDSDHLGSGFDSGSCGSSYASEKEEYRDNELTDDASSIDVDPEEDSDDPFDP